MLEDRIKELTAAVEALTAAMLEAQPAKADAPKPKADEPKAEKPKADEPKADTPKEENPQIKMTSDDLTRMCLGLARDGHRDAIKVKLSTLNVNRVGELEGDAYDAFVDWAVGLASRAEPSE